jgi:hypothetical protein
MTRTDIHRPSAPEFDPQAYVLHGVFDLHLESGDAHRRVEVVNRLVARGFRFANHQFSGQCGHCGAHIRYAALMSRRFPNLSAADAQELIWVGETCLDNRFELTKTEFDRLRKVAQLDREKQAVKKAWLASCEQYPALAYASYTEDIVDAYISEVRDPNQATHLRAGAGWALATAADIARKGRIYGSISERQALFLDKLLREIDEKLAAYAARQAEKQANPDGPVPTGRVQLQGVVLGEPKFHDNDFGGAFKITVKLANGSRVWGSVPSAIEVHKGDEIAFTATVASSEDDPSFGFYKRPAKAVLVKEVVAA